LKHKIIGMAKNGKNGTMAQRRKGSTGRFKIKIEVEVAPSSDSLQPTAF